MYPLRFLPLLPLVAGLALIGMAVAADTTTGAVQITPLTRNSTASAVTLLLAKEGKAQMPIVISEQASSATKRVADELAGYLKRLSGADFVVTSGDGQSGIVLGTLAEFPTPELADALAIVNTFDGREAYAIRTTGDRLLLLGASELGASHAAFRLLEELGVRWFFPTQEWEIVPQVPTVAFARNITDRPSILSRVIWFEAGSGGEQQNREYESWKRHNRQAESFRVNAGHNLDSVIGANQAAFDAHPEYLALVQQGDGSTKRQGPQLELAHPAVRKMVVDYAVKFFNDHPHADMVSLDPADNTAHSISPESLAMGSVSDRVFGMANEAARTLRQEHPGKMVGLYSYSAHWDSPTFAMEPNVHVLMAGLGQGECTAAQRNALWSQRSHNLGVYEYYSVWLWSYDRLPGSGVNDIHGSQARIRDLVARNIKSVNAESTSSWGPNGRGYYIATHLLWNPDLDVDALAQDFYDRAFGAGAAAMKRYYERLAPGPGLFLSKHLLGLAFRDVDEASRLTLEQPDIQARLDHVKLYLRYVYLDWLRNREPASPERQAELTTAIMTYLYRTRLTALTSWELIRQYWGKNKRPGQDYAEWVVDVPYEHADFKPDELLSLLTETEPLTPRPGIETEFQEGLAHFQPCEIGEAVAFSGDLVPVDWPERPAVESVQSYQGSATYFLYSLGGEPLEFTTWAGDAWGGINRFVVTDAEGNEIAQGRLPNKETTHHKIAVPQAGLYKLEYNDNGSHWSMTVAPGRSATLPMGQRQDFRTMKVMQEMVFYVPKGTRQIEYYYTRTAFHPGGPHQVLDPAGNVVMDVNVNGDWVSVPVPEGMDGQLWRLRNPVLGVFWFNNIPNYIAASPDALLLPREVALRDGLSLRR